MTWEIKGADFSPKVAEGEGRGGLRVSKGGDVEEVKMRERYPGGC